MFHICHSAANLEQEQTQIERERERGTHAHAHKHTRMHNHSDIRNCIIFFILSIWDTPLCLMNFFGQILNDFCVRGVISGLWPLSSARLLNFLFFIPQISKSYYVSFSGVQPEMFFRYVHSKVQWELLVLLHSFLKKKKSMKQVNNQNRPASTSSTSHTVTISAN